MLLFIYSFLKTKRIKMSEQLSLAPNGAEQPQEKPTGLVNFEPTPTEGMTPEAMAQRHFKNQDLAVHYQEKSQSTHELANDLKEEFGKRDRYAKRTEQFSETLADRAEAMKEKDRLETAAASQAITGNLDQVIAKAKSEMDAAGK
jgi:hypothetical protein